LLISHHNIVAIPLSVAKSPLLKRMGSAMVETLAVACRLPMVVVMTFLLEAGATPLPMQVVTMGGRVLTELWGGDDEVMALEMW
jgi:hypothetical protein